MSTLAHAYALLNAGRKPEGALLVTQLATAGDAAAMRALGELKWGGTLEQDPVDARRWFERADSAGNRAAARYVTNLLASGIAGTRDWPRALARLRKEAAKDADRRATLALVEAMALDEAGDPTRQWPPARLSERPWVGRGERVLNAAECAYLLKVAEPGYAPATVFDAARRPVVDPMRTSHNSTLHWLIEDPAVHALNRRIAAVTGTRAEDGEALQILRYRPGQQYKPHLDFVRASDNQRHITALVWLNHDYRGGETVFTRTGLKAAGRKGDLLMFRNALPDRALDPLSEHAGLPVVSGTKFMASRWIRERRWAP